MALLVYNLTGAPVALTGIVPAVTVPLSAVAPAPGVAVNVTSELSGLGGAAYVALQLQVTAGSLQYAWSTGVAEYATPGLVVAAEPSVALTSPAAGTGISVVYNGDKRRGSFKITVGYTAWIAAGLTQSITLAVMPAKTRVLSVIADTTAALTNGVSTLALTVGPTGTLAGYIASHDVKTAPVTKGLADADMGSLLTRAAAIQGGSVASWSAGVNLVATLTSGTINLGNGAVTALTTGSTTFYVTVEMM